MASTISKVVQLDSTSPFYEAGLDFLAENDRYEEEKPYHIDELIENVPDHARTNLQFERHTIPVFELRGHEHKLSLESHGVQFFRDRDRQCLETGTGFIVESYMDNIASLLKSELRGELCIAYGYRWRNAAFHPAKPTGEKNDPDEFVSQVHVDQTRKGGDHRARHHLTLEEMEMYLQNPEWRLRILNVWRPFPTTSATHPLAFCDPTSVNQAADLIAADRIGVDYAGEVYYLRPKPYHRWFVLGNQEPNEIVVFVSYDSAENEAEKGFVPHASFARQDVAEGTEVRESIELRLLLITAC